MKTMKKQAVAFNTVKYVTSHKARSLSSFTVFEKSTKYLMSAHKYLVG